MGYTKEDGKTPAKGATDPEAVFKVFAGKLRQRIDESMPAERLVRGAWVPTAPRAPAKRTSG